MPRRPEPATLGPRLVVDPVECDGVGICAHLAPETVTVDSWGFPMIDAAPLTGRRLRRARAAAAACPRRALFLAEPAAGPGRGGNL